MQRLSAIDTHSPDGVLELMQRLDSRGYHRFWATEHYSPFQSASPALVAALGAARTPRLRVGTGGIMLRYASAMRLATDFHLLEALFPGRIDLGVISNGVSDRRLDQRLLEHRPSEQIYSDRVRELASVLRSNGTAGSQPLMPSIRGRKPPDLWVCGVSPNSARLAAEVGAGFAYGAYMAQFTPGGASPDAIAIYKDSFQARPGLSPQTIVSCFGVCADTEALARAVWQPVSPAVPSFLGSPEQCREQIESIAELHGSNEVMVQCLAPTFAMRMRGYDQLAEAFAPLLVSAKP